MSNSKNIEIAIDPNVFAIFDGISLVASITSLVLAIVAIWLAIAFKRDADKVNAETSLLLIEIKSDSKAISQGVMSELKAYGDAMRGTFNANTSNSVTYSGAPENFTMSNNTET
ncbi:hypothetical protein H5185_08785 [Shewanella sp. SG44-6]|uniref:hypothetical protein n=1 Tax=Shewanella sp. SG44-6 TaxID=2760959 RepID=UPI0016009BB6|nr:hypothetical protein [Shewanella sp. SG44-6]MBB1389517.1 hypothetical protein [Shewanella sp. SG44-6]